jgi:ppGpp synthetase/RelA/SpoT-type nucleotidyltranferase
MIPARFRETVDLLAPRVKVLAEYLTSRLDAELAGIDYVTVEPRVKTHESTYEKLQTGKYAKLVDLPDLVGFKVVLLRRSQIARAIDAIQASSLVVVESNLGVSLDPRTFVYHQPHLLVEVPDEFRERHPEVQELHAEVQFTTALQHALDMATHDFDYKGKSFEWSNFRIVAQLRGSLELIDNILDDIETSAKLGKFEAPTPDELKRSQATLENLKRIFGPAKLPEDLRRTSLIVEGLCDAAGLEPASLADLAGRHNDLVSANALNPVDAVLGMLMREYAEPLLEGYEGLFCVSEELESLCSEAAAVPQERRVALSG